MTKKILCLIALLSFSGSVLASSCCQSVVPYLSFRSQGEDAARELVGAGWNTQIYLPDVCKNYYNISITPEYTRSFKPQRLCDCLFGPFAQCGSCGPCDSNCNPCETSCTPCRTNCDDDCCFIRISGSHVANRGKCDWLADYFGLPIDYQSIVKFKPQISNFLVDFNMYVGLDEYCQGLYLRIHAPVVRTSWNLNMCECVVSTGTQNHPMGYFNENTFLDGKTSFTFTEMDDVSRLYGISRENLVSNFQSFVNCCDTIKDNGNNFGVEDDPSNIAFLSYNTQGITFNPLCRAKMDPCKRKRTGLADLQIAIGYNYLLNCDYHAGFNIRATVPTGNRPNGEYLFEPIVGNGKHWELGVGFSGHNVFWKNECDNSSLAVYLDANVTHMFATQQCRTFDLKCKPLSRYMLASYFGTPVENLKAGIHEDIAIAPSKQFKGIYTPVANLTTLPVDVSSSFQADMALMFQYNRCNWSLDIGYNLWARSCEKIKPICNCCCQFEDNAWGLKGDATMYGAVRGEDLSPASESLVIVPLSATQSNATICQGTNNPPDGSDDLKWNQNPGIDNRTRSYTQNEQIRTIESVFEMTEDHIRTSYEPILIRFCDIDFNGARTKGLSHKLFGHVDYTWCDACTDYTPYLGLGFEVEFAHRNCDNYCGGSNCGPCNPCDFSSNTLCDPCGSSCCATSCCCNYCALNQWGIWVKGGVAFN